MIDSPTPSKSAEEITRFARDRRKMVSWSDTLALVSDASLDWLLLNGTAENNDSSFAHKLKAGGLLVSQGRIDQPVPNRMETQTVTTEA